MKKIPFRSGVGMRRTLSALLAFSLVLSLMLCAVPALAEDLPAETPAPGSDGDLISEEPDPEEYSITTYADGSTAFAVFSGDDNSLTFYCGSVPEAGSTYNGKTATEVYQDVAQAAYTSKSEDNTIIGSSAPWDEKKTDITYVVFDSSFQTVQPTSTAYWFFRFENAKSITGLEYLDTSMVTDMSFMFHYCSSVTALDVSGFDTSHVNNMTRMFCRCSGLEELDLTGFDTSKVKNMSYMFSSCSGLQSLTFGEQFDTSSVTTTYCMFADCRALESLDVRGFDTSSVTDMTSMFLHCASLTKLDVSSFDTKNVTTMFRMFCNCPKLQTLKFGDSFLTDSVTDMRSMFYNCCSLKTLDLGSFNTKNVIEYEYFAMDCSELASITIGENFDLFSKSETALVSEQYWNDGSGTQVSENHLIGVSGPGTFYAVVRTFAVYSEEDGSLTFYYDENAPEHFPDIGGTYKEKTVTAVYEGFEDTAFESEHDVPWHSVRESVKSVVFDSSFLEVQPVSMAYWFYEFEKVESFDFTGLDTSKVTDMSYLFYDCFELTELDLTSFTTENVTKYEFFATNCPELGKITMGPGENDPDVSSFDLFYKSESALVSEQYWVDEIGNEISSHHMIGVKEPGTYSAAVGPTAFAVYSADDESLIFYYDSSYEPMVPTVGDTYNKKTVTDVYVGFDDSHYTADHEVPWHEVRENIQSVSFDATFAAVQPIATEYWFYDFCSATSLDFTNLDTSKVTNFSNFAVGCTALKTVTFGSGFDLFSRSENALVSQQYWLDEDNQIQSQNYLIGIAAPGTYYATEALTSHAFAVYSTEDNALIFYWDKEMVYAPVLSYDGRTVSEIYTGFDTSVYTEASEVPWHAIREDVKTVSFDSSFRTVQPASMAYWFYEFADAETISLANLDTSECTSMYCTFEYCQSVKTLDLSSLNTGKVTTMEGMFRDCESLVSVNVSGLDVSSVTTMNTMFRDCASLKEVDFTGWETSSITNLGQFLQGCTSLTEVDLSMFDVSHATALANIFNGCTNLVTINVCNWDTSSATGMASTFANCISLQTIYASRDTWVVGENTNKTNTFNNCSTSLVGGAGTVWSGDNITADMAHVDTLDDPGYFTLLESSSDTDDTNDGENGKTAEDAESSGPEDAAGIEYPFTDVTDESKYYFDAIVWAKESGIAQGYPDGSFGVQDTQLRRDMITFLYRLAGEPDPDGTAIPFTDVPETSYYYDAVCWGYAEGIVLGVSSTEFAPDDPCTREQFVTLLYRMEGSPEVSGTVTFQDVDPEAYYYDAVVWTAENGYVLGYNENSFGTGDPILRVDTITILYRMNLAESGRTA